MLLAEVWFDQIELTSLDCEGDIDSSTISRFCIGGTIWHSWHSKQEALSEDFEGAATPWLLEIELVEET